MYYYITTLSYCCPMILHYTISYHIIFYCTILYFIISCYFIIFYYMILLYVISSEIENYNIYMFMGEAVVLQWSSKSKNKFLVLFLPSSSPWEKHQQKHLMSIGLGFPANVLNPTWFFNCSQLSFGYFYGMQWKTSGLPKNMLGR